VFQTKICGITSAADALLAAGAGADALGLNFCPHSPRCVTLEVARTIVDLLPARVARVGVFVNASSEEVAAVADQLRLDFIQLHGDEPPARLKDLVPRQVIRAFRMRGDRIDTVLDYLRACHECGAPPAAILVDAFDPGRYGGTGKAVDWGRARELSVLVKDAKYILAGGLTPDNVGAAIAAVRPWGVDVASGVESRPGTKDGALMRRWVDEARKAFQGIR